MTTITAPAATAPQLAGCDTEFLSRQSTKVMIQEISTRRFLATTGVWTADPGQALTFRSGSAAMEHLTQRKLTNVQLVLTRAITVSEVIPVTTAMRGC
jgi:hypothetical protein